MPSISSFLATLDEPARTPAVTDAAAFIKGHEGLRLDAYADQGGVPTIGYGHTATAKPGTQITEPEANRLFDADFASAQSAVDRLVKVPLAPQQRDALTSWVFNVGEGAAAGSTLLKSLNAGHYDAVAAELPKWNHVGGQVSEGLSKRREAETTLWSQAAMEKATERPAAKGKPSISAFLKTLDEGTATSNTSPNLKRFRQDAVKRFPGLSRYENVHVVENTQNPTKGEFYSAEETKDHPNPGFPTVHVGLRAGQDIDAAQPGPADIIVNDMLHYALNEDPILADLKAQFVQNLPPELLEHERNFYERKLRQGATGSHWASFETAMAGPMSDGLISGYVRGEPEYVEVMDNLAKTAPLAAEAAQGIQDYLKQRPSTGKSISAFLATLDKDERSEFGKGLAGYLLASGPEAIGSFIEAVGVTTGSTWLSRDAANWVHGIGNDPADYAPKVGGWEQVDWDAWDTEPLKVVDQITDFLSYGLGSGLASTIPPIAGGMAGFAAAGPAGALAGAFGPSYVQNTGPLYADLIEEGVPKEDAGPIALLGGLPIAALDVIFPSGRAKAVLGKAKRDVTRGLAKRLASEFFRGTWQEGIPEGLQGLLNDVIVYKAAGKDIDWEKTRLAVLNEGTLGAVTGGIIGGVTGVVPDTPRPAVPQPGAEPPAPPPIPEEPVVPPEAEVTPAAATPPTAPPGAPAAPAPPGAPSGVGLAEAVGAIPGEEVIGPAPGPAAPIPEQAQPAPIIGAPVPPIPPIPPAEPAPLVAPETVDVDTGIAPPQTAPTAPSVQVPPAQEVPDALAGEIPAPTAPAPPAGAVVSSPLTEQQRAAEQDFLAIKRLRDVKRQADLEREQAISPEATPVETDPLARLPEVRAFLDKRKNKVTPKALAEALDMTPIQARRVLDHMAAVGDRVQKTPKGYRRQSRANLGAASLAEFISENGGIQDPRGDLGEDGRDWHRRAPFRKKLVRDDGLPVDEMRLRAVERGYPIPGAYDSQESDLLSLLAQDIDSTPTRIYVPEEMAEVQESPRELERERDINRNAMELEADRLGLNPADVISMTDPDLTAAIAGADPEGAEAAAQVLEDEVDRIVWEVLQSESVEEDIQDEIPDIPFPEAAKPETEPPPGGPDQEADRPPRPEPELEGPPQARPETSEGGDQAAIAGAGFQPGDPVETLNPVTGEWEAGEFAGTLLDGRVLQVRMHAPTTSGSTGVYGFSPDSVRAPVPKKKAEIAREKREAAQPPKVAKPAEPVSREIPPATEPTDQGDQVVMPGVAPITDKDRLEVAAGGKAKAKVAQKEADEGLFGGPLQPDLVDLAKPPKAEEPELAPIAPEIAAEPPTWAQVVGAAPKRPDGQTDIDLVVTLMKETTDKSKFADFTDAEARELLAKVQAATGGEAPAVAPAPAPVTPEPAPPAPAQRPQILDPKGNLVPFDRQGGHPSRPATELATVFLQTTWAVSFDKARARAERSRSQHSSKKIKGEIGRVIQGLNQLEREGYSIIDPYQPAPLTPTEPVAPPASATKLREGGEKLIAKGEESMGQDRQDNTARRARMAASAEASAAADVQLGQTMIRLADAIEAGEAPQLAGIRSKAQVDQIDSILRQAMYARDREETKDQGYAAQKRRKGRPPEEADLDFVQYPWPAPHPENLKDLLTEAKGKPGTARAARKIERHTGGDRSFKIANPDDIAALRTLLAKTKGSTDYSVKRVRDELRDFDRVQKMGFTDAAQLREAMAEYLPVRAGRAKADPIKQLERELIGLKIPGFFPTPPAVIDRMIDAAGIEPGMRVLEPSAGKGDIVDAVVKITGPGAIDVLEPNSRLREILTTKEYALLSEPNFLELDQGNYDRIVMNPPFEQMQDIDHVRHAYDLLAPGGRLVSIMSPSWQFRQNKKAEEFREWLESVGSRATDMPEGSFKSAFRPTGVATRLVVIDKPTETPRRLSVAERPPRPTRQQVDEKIYRDLEREIQRLAPGLLWQVTPRIEIAEVDRAMFEASGGDGYPAAYYENGMATFAWDAMRAEGAIPLVSHEVIHYLRDRNFFKPKEWALLEAQSRENWMDRYGLPHEPQNRDVVEEGVAYAFQQWRTDGVSAVGGPVARIFRRLQAFIERLVRGLLGRQTAEDVFQKVAAGKVGRRTRGARQGPGGVSYAAAYHGGPHDFDRFSTDAIGTGEGAQAYGWGLYFAGKEGVARYYQEKLTKGTFGTVYKINGETIPDKWDSNDIKVIAGRIMIRHKNNKKDALREIDKILKTARAKARRIGDDSYVKDWEAQRRFIENIEGDVEIVPPARGHLYEVDLAPAESDYLYWDKPLSEQSEKVKVALRQAGDIIESNSVRPEEAPDHSGARAYDSLQDFLRAPRIRENAGLTNDMRMDEAASRLLAKLGIPGIKFLDQGSRSKLYRVMGYGQAMAGPFQTRREAELYVSRQTDRVNLRIKEEINPDATYNYVIFDDRHIDIKRKYAVRREGPGSYQAETEDWAAQIREQFGDPVTAEEINRARGPMYALAGRVQGTAQQEAILERIGQAPREQPIGHRIREGIAAIKDRAGEKVRQAMIDNFDAIAVLEKTDNNGKLLDASVGAYKAARLSRELSSTMHVLLKHGMVGYKNGGFEVVPGHDGGFEGIFHDIADRGLLQLWQGWAIAQRSQRLIGEGREKLLSQADINALLPLSAQYPEFQVAMDKWAAFNKSILDTAEKAGIIDPASRALWENNDYVPFYRMLQEAGGGPTSKRGLVNQRSGIKTLKGGEEAVRDLIENMVMNVAHMVDASYKNVAGVRTVDLGLRSGALEEVGMDWRKQIIPAPQAAKALRDVGVDVKKMDKAQREQWLKVFALQQPRGRDIISVMRGGKPVYYRVNDPMLLASLTSLHEVPFESAVMRIAGTAKSWLTKGVTTFPDFMIRNLMRDTGSAWVVTGGKTGPLKAAKGFAAALNESTSQVAIAAAGGGTIGWYDVEPEAVKKQISLGSSPKNMAHRLWLMWQRIGQATENANRIALYDSLRAAGVSHAEAAYQAKDLMDFSMHGGATSMRALIQVVPFLNARVQGLYKLARGAAENPVGFMLRGGAIMAATLALLADNWDEEDYEALPDWDKDTYYHLFVAGEHFRLPKAFEVGALFSTVPERITRLAFGRDKPKKAAQRALAMFAETFAFDPTPQIVKPMLEQYANRNSFTGAPIVPDRLEGLRPGEQVTDRTSAVAEGLGRLFPNVVSPVRVDSLMRGYLATLGTTLLATTDVAADLYDPVPRPTRRIDEIPVIGGFIRDNPAWSTVYMADFYDFRREVNRFVRSAKELRKQGRGEEALELLRGRPKAVPQAKFTNKVGHTLAKLNTRLRQVRRDRNMAPDEKRRQIDRIIGRRNALAKSAMAKIERHAQP